MKYLTTFFLGIFLAFCGPQPNVLEQVQQEGVLRVVTWLNPTTYYLGANGETGLAYDLVAAFAEDLGVRLEPVLVDSHQDVVAALEQGQGQLAAARLAVTPQLKERVRLGPAYQQVTQYLVYRYGTWRPRSLEDLQGRRVEVRRASPEAMALRELLPVHPGLTWRENDEANQAELLELVWQQVIPYTVASEDELALARRYHPELKAVLPIGEPLDIAWAFPERSDDSLYVAAIRFFNELRRTGELERIVDRHQGHIADIDILGTRKFITRYRMRLPSFLEHFRGAAGEHTLDWRLLAAVGYQESHWNPEAVSPTGVRGLMMLTRATASDLGVEDRRDPRQSIYGGARYLRQVKGKIPERIPEPDRTWLALASYNVGFGHLEDARRLTQKLGGNPDLWVDVKEHLPLLRDKKYYSQTRYGFARGDEPVHYVENIRRYYELLVWLDHTEEATVIAGDPIPAAPATL